MNDIVIPWGPQPRQGDLLKACGLYDFMTTGAEPQPPVCRMIGYGGAAFGGKTDGLLGIGMVAAFAYPGCKVGFFRRKFTELEGADGAIERSLELMSGFGEYNAGRHRWALPGGSRLYFNHCHRETDVYDYQSQAWDILLADEVTHFSWKIIDYLITRNRPTSDIPGLVPFTVMGTNPGNVGHQWFSQVFDVLEEDGPPEQVKDRYTPNESKEKSYFIPAFLEDNPIGLERDPEYPDRLEARDPDVARALRWGDWTVFAGQAFRTWSQREHVIDPIDLPVWWPRWRAIDWGSAKPFCCLWFAKDPDLGRIYMYREAYAKDMDDQAQARLVYEMTPPWENITITYADPSMWAKKNYKGITTTTAQEYMDEKVPLTRADNDRLNGKRKVDRILGKLPDGGPGLLVFRNCRNFIRTLPALPYDETNSEDVDTDAEDHAYDTLRYGLTKYRSRVAKKRKPARSPLQEASYL